MANLQQRLRNRLRNRLVGRVRRELAPRAEAAEGIRLELDELGARLEALENRASAWLQSLPSTGPFTAQMTMDAAWRRHPGARKVFEAHHLPACDGCAVRHDETLEEAARAYELDLVAMLAMLNDLLGNGTQLTAP